jgi:hypothetical protein
MTPPYRHYGNGSSRGSNHAVEEHGGWGFTAKARPLINDEPIRPEWQHALEGDKTLAPNDKKEQLEQLRALSHETKGVAMRAFLAMLESHQSVLDKTFRFLEDAVQ